MPDRIHDGFCSATAWWNEQLVNSVTGDRSRGEGSPWERWPGITARQYIRSNAREGTAVTQDINVLALVKGNERYVFLYNDASRAETLRVLGRYASNPDLSFSWYDAAVLSQKIRQESQPQPARPRFEQPLSKDLDDQF